MRQRATRNLYKLQPKIVKCMLIFVLLLITIILSVGIPWLFSSTSSF